MKLPTMLACTLVLAACTDTIELDSDVSSAIAPDRAVAPVGATVSDLSVSYELLSEPAVDQPLEILLKFEGVESPASLRLQPGDGVEIGNAQAVNLEIATGESDVRVTIVPNAAGRSYLGIILTRDSDVARMITSVSIPIQVGPVAPAQPRAAAR